MTERERILAVEYNEKPDRIPYMLDFTGSRGTVIS